jgi:uncharacterized protein
MLDLLLVMVLGFLGSFGHCLGMCGPLAVAFSFSQQQSEKNSIWQQLYFHSILNIARIISYTFVGAGIGAIGSVLIASGQWAGIGSGVRQGVAILTGVLLIGMGLHQIKPNWLPRIPYLHPLLQGQLHDRLLRSMDRFSTTSSGLTPLLLGLMWGWIPCGFLYAAQVKAAETGNPWQGAATLLAFGLGTLPSMVGIGVSASWMSRDRRSQLFQLGGWVMLVMGLVTLFRTGAMMKDLTGYGSLICLMLALIARPMSRLWPGPLRYRRLIGVSAFLLAIAHTLQMMQHTLNWNLAAISFMVSEQQWGLWAGIVAVLLMLPLAVTSFDGMIRVLGPNWRRIHLLVIPAWILAITHTIWLGSRYLGGVELGWANYVCIASLGVVCLGVLLIRQPLVWSLLSLKRFYGSVQKPTQSPP